MQTKLTAVWLMLAASLLWTPHAVAAPKHSGTKDIKLTWCDLHVCQEKPHYFGKASFYGKGYWQGRKMANGERFDYRKKTVALWFLPLGTMVRILNLTNGKSVVAEVTDRGPAHALHRVADLSQAAAEELDYIDKGLTIVLIEPMVDPEPEAVNPEIDPPQTDVDNLTVASIIE